MPSAMIDHIKIYFRPFSTILGLTIALTCIMLALLLMQPGPVSYQCSCAGFAKKKRSANNPLFMAPVLLYPVQSAGAQGDTGSSIE